MQVTIDIPQQLYDIIVRRASFLQTSVEAVTLEQVKGLLPKVAPKPEGEGKRVELPLIRGKLGTVNLTKNLNDAMFDDFDPS